MVKITRGNHTIMVTRGAFHNYYESQGYKLVEAPKSHEDNPNGFTGGDGHSTDHEPTGTSGDYTPEQIKAMTTDQLYEVADKLGINPQEVRTKGDLVKMIIQAL